MRVLFCFSVLHCYKQQSDTTRGFNIFVVSDTEPDCLFNKFRFNTEIVKLKTEPRSSISSYSIILCTYAHTHGRTFSQTVSKGFFIVCIQYCLPAQCKAVFTLVSSET